MEQGMAKVVTEQDLRRPEFRHARLEDLEFRADGAIVRKDRWETGIRRIVCILDMSSSDFEIDDVVSKVRALVEQVPLTTCQADCDGNCSHAKCPQHADGEPIATGRHCPLDSSNQAFGGEET